MVGEGQGRVELSRRKKLTGYIYIKIYFAYLKTLIIL
jgi:hypothetical protein